MIRKAAVIVAIALLTFTTACSSSSSPAPAAAGATATAAAAAATTCPTSNTKSFAKTRFVASAALAGGAFKRYIYTPAKEGKFDKGASGRVTALVKAAAAGALAINRLDAAKSDAQANPTLCKLIVTPLEDLRSSITGLVTKSKTGGISSTDVDGAASQLEDFRSAATHGGAGFTENTNVSP
jgi:hypothetical protein